MSPEEIQKLHGGGGDGPLRPGPAGAPARAGADAGHGTPSDRGG